MGSPLAQKEWGGDVAITSPFFFASLASCLAEINQPSVFYSGYIQIQSPSLTDEGLVRSTTSTT